jgi:hypothetical protein
MDKPKFILLTETTAQSWKRDASTFCLAFACFVPGWFLNMWTMDVLGVLILLYFTARSLLKIGGDAMTPAQARQKIAEIEKAYGEGS